MTGMTPLLAVMRPFAVATLSDHFELFAYLDKGFEIEFSLPAHL